MIHFVEKGARTKSWKDLGMQICMQISTAKNITLKQTNNSHKKNINKTLDGLHGLVVGCQQPASLDSSSLICGESIGK